MDCRKCLFSSLLAASIALGCGAATSASAAGYALFTQGASALGQGNAVTAHTDSPNTIFYNPALMSRLDGTRVEVGSTAIWASRQFESAQPTGTSTSKDSFFFPSTFYVTHKFNDAASAGLGVFSPFGLGTEWDANWEGRYLSTKAKLVSFDINPVVSYRIIPGLAVAAGLDVVLVDATLAQRLPPTVFGTPSDVALTFKGNGTGVGFNAALAYEMNKELSFGVSYRSQVAVELKGDSSTSLQVTPLDSSGRTGIKLPQQLTAGVAYRVAEPLIVEAGVRWEGWSSFQKLQLLLDDNAPVPATQRSWHDTFGLNLGGKYRLNDTVAFMAGYIFGNNAVPDSTFDPSIPDADTHIFCFGTELSYRSFNIALSYAYQLYLDRTKNNSVDSLLPPHYADGNYKGDAHLLALSVGYKF